jgi:hypothetical protein
MRTREREQILWSCKMAEVACPACSRARPPAPAGARNTADRRCRPGCVGLAGCGWASRGARCA